MTQKYIESLNTEQKEAVLFKDGACIVLAAAGSGKTKTLISRYANLIHEGETVNSILALTFTNKAAREMRERLVSIHAENTVFNNPNDLQKSWIGTFHGIAHKIMRAHVDFSGYKRNFSIMDSADQLSFTKKLVKSIGENGLICIDGQRRYLSEDFQASELVKRISQWKEKGLRFSALRMTKDSTEDEIVIMTLYALYEEECKKNNVVDFCELLLCVVEMFDEYPDMKKMYAGKFRYIMVDEFQDTNPLQYRWLKQLASVYGNLFVVGDDDQSIYKFRGAEPGNIKSLKKDFNAQIIKIEKNYRSKSHILDAANAVIKNNTDRMGKMLVSTRDSHSQINEVCCFDNRDESDYIAETILKLKSKDMNWNDFAILYRTNSLSRSLESAMNSRGIPYVIHGGLRFFDRMEIKHVIAYLKLLISSDDNLSLLRIINVPSRKIGEAFLSQLETQTKGLSLMKLIESDSLDSKSQKKLDSFKKLILELRNDLQNKTTLKSLIETIIDKTGLKTMYSEGKEKDEDRVANLEELISAASFCDMENSQLSFEERLELFLAGTALDSEVAKESPDRVQLMTVHTSKGLEFKHVFVVGVEDGLFPHMFSIQSKDKSDLEEERRLFYVALTRAKNEIELIHCEERFINGQASSCFRSRFMKEIPGHLIKKTYFQKSDNSYKKNSYKK